MNQLRRTKWMLGMPLRWFWIDFSFAPAAALPLWIALHDVRRAEAQIKKR
jgi:hypothetical protein